MHKGSSPYSYSTSNQTKSVSQTQQVQNGVYKMMSKDKLGMVMTDLKGMTVYTFAKDTTSVSSCVGGCLQAWPAYTAPSQTGNFPANISVISVQMEHYNMPGKECHFITILKTQIRETLMGMVLVVFGQ